MSGAERKTATIPAPPRITCPHCTARISSACKVCHWCKQPVREQK